MELVLVLENRPAGNSHQQRKNIYQQVGIHLKQTCNTTLESMHPSGRKWP